MINNQNLAVLSEKVAYLENALKTAGVLPEVSASDNGVALQVVNGAWAKGDAIPEVINALDSTSETNALSAAQGKALSDKIGGLIKSKTVSVATNSGSGGTITVQTNIVVEKIISICLLYGDDLYYLLKTDDMSGFNWGVDSNGVITIVSPTGKSWTELATARTLVFEVKYID